jgi:hypothetical protein
VPHWKKIEFEQTLETIYSHRVDEQSIAKVNRKEIFRRAKIERERDSGSEEDWAAWDWNEMKNEATGELQWYSVSRDVTLFTPPYTLEQSLVGRQVRIFWNMENCWFPAYLTRFNATKELFCVQYDDGDHEWMHFGQESDRVQIFDTEYGSWSAYSAFVDNDSRDNDRARNGELPPLKAAQARRAALKAQELEKFYEHEQEAEQATLKGEDPDSWKEEWWMYTERLQRESWLQLEKLCLENGLSALGQRKHLIERLTSLAKIIDFRNRKQSEKDAEIAAIQAEAQLITDGWVEQFDFESQKTFYHNTVTSETVWDKPKGFQSPQQDQDDDDALAKPPSRQKKTKRRSRKKKSSSGDQQDDG